MAVMEVGLACDVGRNGECVGNERVGEGTGTPVLYFAQPAIIKIVAAVVMK